MKKLHWVLLTAIVIAVLIIYQYPNIVPLGTTPPGYSYALQNHFFDPWDVNVYVSAIRYGQHHDIFYPNLYTTTPNRAVLIYSFLTSLGLFFKNVNPFFLFHTSAAIAGTVLVLGIFWAIRAMGVYVKEAFISLVIICFGGGLGFLGPELGSADITDSSFSFYSTFQKGHEAAAILGYIVSLALFYQLCTQGKITILKLFFLILSLCIALFIYPYFAISYFCIVGISIITIATPPIKKFLLPLVAIFIPALVVSLFSLQQLLINPTWYSTGLHLSINMISICMGYGFLSLLFFYYLFYVSKSTLGIYLSIWISITFLLAILPFGPGKIFLRGLFFPVSLLGIIALESFIKNKTLGQKQFIYSIFFIVTLATSLIIFYTRLNQPFPWTYLSNSQFAVMEFLDKNTPPDSGILTNYQLSNRIPAFTHNRVFLGHSIVTPNSEEKSKELEGFIIGNGSIQEKKYFLKKNNISYIVWGKEEQIFYERNIHPDNKLMDFLSTLNPIYKNSDFKVYSIK